MATPEVAITYLDRNGLKGGKIPAGHGCPFLDSCKNKEKVCPTAQHTFAVPYDCEHARMHSYVSTVRVTTNLKKVTPGYSIIPQAVVIIDTIVPDKIKVIKPPLFDEGWETP